MTEETNTGVTNQEVVAPENDSKVSDNNANNSETQQSTQEKSKDYNWRRMEEKNEALARQVEELMRDKKEKATPPPVEEDDLSSLADDDIITISQARRLAKKEAEELVNKTFAAREKADLPNKTRSKFNDFDNIMTQENIKKLEQEEPDLAEACSKASNPWEATYKILKKFIPTPEEQKSSDSGKKLDENLSKPGSINSVGKVKPLSNAEMWSESTKERLYKEMMECSSRV